MRKNNKYIPFLDKFPFIVFAIILILSLTFFLLMRERLPLNFFSSTTAETESKKEYTIFITSPSNNEIFNFVNQNEAVPVEIKAKEIENLGYIVKVFINDEEIQALNSPPYKFNWNPNVSGEYEIVASVFDENSNLVSTSNKVDFLVEYAEEDSTTTVMSTNVEEKKNKILSQSQYRSQNCIPQGIPIFSYKCYIPPLIDGSIQEWENFEKFSNFNPTILKEHYTTHTDISGTFYSCWDADNFYFAIQVVDDVFNQPFTGNQINKGDSIVMVFDTDLEEDMQIPFYNSDDYRIDFSPGNFSNILPESFINWPYNSPPNGVSMASTKLANGYIIEASIPWYNFLNYTPQDEDLLGFTVSIFDTDNLVDTDNVPITELVVSSSKQFDLNNVSTLGTLVLIDAGDIQQELE